MHYYINYSILYVDEKYYFYSQMLIQSEILPSVLPEKFKNERHTTLPTLTIHCLQKFIKQGSP